MDPETDSAIVRGRRHYESARWADAFEALRDAQRRGRLECADLKRLAWSAALIGDDDAFLDALENLYLACMGAGDARQAAWAAFWLGFRLFALGAPGRASGWLARAERQLEAEPDDCLERGYLLVPGIYGHLANDRNAEAQALAEQTGAIAARHQDTDLATIARNLQGRALLRRGECKHGLAALDEVMVTVVSGQLSPVVRGLVYCNVIATCHQFCALDRAREWTAALAEWCDRQPQLLTFTGNCHVHRSQIMQLAGDWCAALEEVRRIDREEKPGPDPEISGEACYQEGELHRLRGEFEAAETAYHEANRLGRDPQPGLALMRMAQGHAEEAVRAIARALGTTWPAWRRAQLLPAFVEITLAAGELEEARTATAELGRIAAAFDTGVLVALASQALGALRLAEARPAEAVAPLRRALSTWQRVGAPYLGARIRVLIGHAYRELGDAAGAALEEDAARQIFEELGAGPDLRAITLGADPDAANRHGLSRRELQVLRLVATGRTNKAIAAKLCLSERTVDRHVSSILSKLGVTSRSAATAFAYEHGLA